MGSKARMHAGRLTGFRDPSNVKHLHAYIQKQLPKRQITPQSIIGTFALFGRVPRKTILNSISAIKGIDSAAIMRDYAKLKRAAARQKKVHG